MRLQLDTGRVVFRIEPGDTVDDVAQLIDLLADAQCTQRVTDDGVAFAIHIQPSDDCLQFIVAVPKGEDSDDTLLTLCAAYLSQQESPD